MAANDAVSMNVAENRQNVPMAIQENRAAVPMTVAEGGGTPGGLNKKADKVTGAAAGNLAGLDSTGNLTDSGKAPGDFLEAPAAAGSEGQVLTADGEGGASWQDPTGGDPTEIIDDTAGSGDTDKVWSADKSASEAQSLMTEINSKADEPTGTKVAGKVYGLDSNLNPAWVDGGGGGGGSVDPQDIAQAVADWCEENITEDPTVVIDESLLTSGAAADSYITGSVAKQQQENLKSIGENLNLFDIMSAQKNGRLSDQGIFVAVDGYFTSDYIPIENGKTYYKNSPTENAYHRYCLYSSKSEEGYIIYSANPSNTIAINNVNAKYLRFCGAISEIGSARIYTGTTSAIDVKARAKLDTLGFNERKYLESGSSSGTNTFQFKNVVPEKTYILFYSIVGASTSLDVYNMKTGGATPTIVANITEQYGFVRLPTTSDTSYLQVYVTRQGFVKYDLRLFEEDTILQSMSSDMMNLSKSSVNRPINVLVIGDSYSENGGQWIRPMMGEFPAGSTWISLGVTSASLKDKYADRTQYPYTSRPTSSVISGNLNTFACQIEKLKRLMAGTDLDQGETQIYATEESYPDVIIIEGGKNDYYDNQTKEDSYWSQIEKQVTDVYIKQKSSSTASVGNCYIATPIDEVDRTCFAGAYRYLITELSTLFPKAFIFITTVSPVRYHTDSCYIDYMIAEQQRKCAKMCNATLIDWYQEGQVSLMMNSTTGSGTQEDPYVYAGGTRETSDSLHVNATGGKKYGKLASLVIKNRFVEKR